METEETWALLVSLTDIDTDPIPISKAKFVFGRAEDCDQSFPENKLVSGHHCYIEKEEGSEEHIWLYDTSTNGTVLNMTSKITKGNCKKLKHGDEFYIVYKKDNEDVNVGYVFQSLRELEKEQEQEETQEYSPNAILDSTLVDDDCNLVEEVAESGQGAKRKSAESTPEEVSKKRLKKDEKGLHRSETTAQPVIESKSADLEEETKITPSDQMETEKHNQKDKADVQDSSSQKETEKHDQKDKAAVQDSSSQKETEKHDQKEKMDVEVSFLVPQKEMNEGDMKIPEPVICQKDNMEENLLCSICQEIMHDCISLQPCLHTFCAGCYSDWMKRSEDCPSCRKKVRRINKNHIVNNLIEAYLKERPEKKRPEEDLKELNNKNAITKDMLYPKNKYPKMRDDDDDDDNEDSEDYSDTDDDEEEEEGHNNFRVPAANLAVFQPAPAPLLLGFGTPFFGTIRPPKTVCRQCPEYKSTPDSWSGLTNTVTAAINTVNNIITGNNSDMKIGNNDTTGKKEINDRQAGGDNPSTSGGTEADDKASTSRETDIDKASSITVDGCEKIKRDDEKVTVNAPPYTCSPQQTHILCQCCLQPMPDRRAEHARNLDNIPAQQCSICFRAYCHAYWGCRKADCLGCLAKFKDLNFGRKSLDYLVLDNPYESNILKKYLDNHTISVREVLNSCLQKMQEGKYTCIDQARGVNPNSWLCYACGLKNLKYLAYMYRRDIPRNHLPDEVTARPDCHWGRNCRTQRNKPHHAANFNHICEQRRFM